MLAGDVNYPVDVSAPGNISVTHRDGHTLHGKHAVCYPGNVGDQSLRNFPFLVNEFCNVWYRAATMFFPACEGDHAILQNLGHLERYINAKTVVQVRRLNIIFSDTEVDLIGQCGAAFNWPGEVVKRVIVLIEFQRAFNRPQCISSGEYSSGFRVRTSYG